MIWLEMFRGVSHGGGNWDFGECLWSPIHKKDRDGILIENSSWPYWENLLKVQAGDTILHLKGKDSEAAFVGFSTAVTDGFKTSECPPEPGEYGYDKAFYKVPLKDYIPLKEPLLLNEVFRNKKQELYDYYATNSRRVKDQKRTLFYVIQAGNLQCQNGAYLTEIESSLATIILGNDYSASETGSTTEHGAALLPQTETGERLREMKSRVGQKTFSDNVKANYDNHCCFPGCDVNDRNFLVGSHIARWADQPQLRGDLTNGLCFCVFHDKAFEMGYFTFDKNLRVSINKHNPKIQDSDIKKTTLNKYDGQPARAGKINPSIDSLRYHWERQGYPLK